MRRLTHRLFQWFAHAAGLAALASLIPLAAAAQTVKWNPPAGQLGFNQVSQLSLVFENCEPDGAPALPQVDGLTFGRPSQSSETSIVNFNMTRTFSLVYPVRPSKRSTIAIPAFEVKTDKGSLKVAAAAYTVGDATVGNSGVSLDEVASAKLSTPEGSFWAGEVFPVTFQLDVARRYFHSLVPDIEWTATPLVAEEWSKPDPGEAVVGGAPRVVSVQNTRAYVKQPGTFAINPASQLVNLVVGSTGFGFFSQPSVEQRRLATKPVTVTIKPLPPAPRGFSGAVGEFTFTSKVVPLTAGIGEPVTWTIELSGTGNWPDIAGLPARDVSNDFQVVQPKSKRTMKGGSLFDGTLTEDVVLVPTKAGTYPLAQVQFTYFDPKAGAYRTVTSEPVTVTVTAGAAPAPAPAGAGAPHQFTIAPPPDTPAAPPPPSATPPVTPENLPRDPLATPAHGTVPFKAGHFWLVAALPAIALVLIVWLVLAAIRSRQTDPRRYRRAARARIGEILAELRSAGTRTPGIAARLKTWQEQVALLWEIPHAAPGAPLVQSSVALREKDAGATWGALWSDADRALHGREHQLPDDWLARADAALDAVRVPGWAPASLLLPRNLFPYAFALGLLLLSVPSPIHAESADDAYKRGDFAAAETGWTKSLADAPGDWALRHNLGLALAQQDRWAEATGYWTGAFLLHPRGEATRWDLALGLQRSGMAPAQLVELSRGEGRFKLVRFASPGEWQVALIIAALLLAAALVVLLFQGYKRTGGHWARPTALITSLVAVALAAAATLSLHTYGVLADPDVALVWKASTLRSIPTEADTTQKTSPLSAGSIAIAEKTFLGWTKLNFPGGQAGWVRTEDLIGLYR